MPNFSPEFIAAVPSVTKVLTFASPGILLSGAVAKAYETVHKTEAAVIAERGDPMLKPEIYALVAGEICRELPERRIGFSGIAALKHLPRRERRERIQEKVDALPEYMTRDGVYRVVTNDRVWTIPLIQKVVKINVGHQTSNIPPFAMESSDDVQINVNPAIAWRVRADGDNPYKAL
jgi:hypothetical protein